MNMPHAPLILIVIPVFNHSPTLRQVVSETLGVHPHVLVVDDGSTDMPKATGPEYPQDHPLHGLPIHFVRHAANKGKGKAILTGADYARTLGMSHIITLDADAQHYPSDLPAFIEAVHGQPLALFVGTRDFSTSNVPKASRFGRSFSNFWYKVQTGQELADTQSGFRAYPLAILDRLALHESRYSFEIEVLVRAAWAGFAVLDIPVRVHYAPGAQRVSHFHPIMDNVRLSILNTRLTFRAIMPIPQKRFEQNKEGKITALHPLRSLRVLLTNHETPRALAVAGALGMFIGTLPLIGLHSILIILALGSLKLNKITGLATSQLCMPPLLPAMCIETGYYLRHGYFLTDISWQTLGREALQRLGEWVLGAAVLAPILALAVGLIVYVLALIVQRGLRCLPERTLAWSSRSIGSRLQHKLFYVLISLGGVKAAYALLFWVIMWYTCVPSVTRRSAAYLQRRFPKARGYTLWRHRFCLHWEFGKCLVDRAAAGITGKFYIHMDEPKKQQLRDAHGEGKGLIVVASHVGCWHMSMSGLAELLPGPTSVVLHRDTGDVDRHYYEHTDKAPPFEIIDPSLGAFSTVAMLQCVQKGGVLALMGDRAFDNARLCDAPFMGSTVGFPYLAYHLASVSGAPVAVFFAYRTTSGESCHVLADIIRVPPRLGKKGQAYAPYVRRYAEALEGSVAEQPYQFFNFYDMWGEIPYERERKTENRVG